MSYSKNTIFACSPATSRGHPIQLGADPKGVNFLYTNGRTVIIRNIANPAIAAEYTGHNCAATVARYSPSGFYIASGDVNGNVRIWDTTQAENILKCEVKVLAGKIHDLSWDSESQRIIAVGDGKERYGHAFMFDSGSSCGEISGHSKVINSVSIRQSRPFRAVTCSDDMTISFFHGTPFKFSLSHNDHTRFVQCVKFSPSGDHFVSAGSDGKLFLYDGKTGAKLSDLSAAAGADNGHKGGIYSVAWSPTSTELLTSSGDGTCKLWDIASQKVTSTHTFADKSEIEDQQVGNLWQGEHMLSVSLSGDINYLDKNSPRPHMVLRGHQKGITAITSHPLEASETFFTGSYDGRVYAWEGDTGNGIPVTGAGHTNQINGLATTTSNGQVTSIAMDDTLRVVDAKVKLFGNLSVATGSVPNGVAIAPSGEFSVMVTMKEVILLSKSSEIVARVDAPFTPLSVSIHPSGQTAAVGGQDNKVHLYKISGNSIIADGLLESNRGPVTAVAFSPDGSLLAAGDGDRKVLCYDVASKTVKISHWCFHTAKVGSVAWSPDGKHAVSGSLDTNVYVWSVDKPMKNIAIKGAHQGEVTGVTWKGNSTVVSVGADACVKTWNIKFHA